MSRPLAYYLILTTDGLYADPEGGLDHYEPAEDEHRYANELVRDAGDIVIARKMYEVMDYWDDLDLDDPATPGIEREFAEYWRGTPKHVVTRGTPALRANATILAGDDAVAAIRELKAGDGPPIMLSCGASLFAELSAAGLIDAYRFLVTPTALGQGKRLFGELREPLRMRLVGTRTFDAGSVLLDYERAD